MKGLKLLILPAIGFVLFVTGLLISDDLKMTRDAFIVAAVLITLVFYFITLAHVIKTFMRGYSKRLFWLVAIVCMPVIGNIIYVIFLETANKKQEPHGVF